MSQTKLPHYLWPKGRSNSEPSLMPNVNDSDGNAVLFNSDKRKTTEATVVNLGDSPNSNNGDPLRTAFAKINNFIEATYWWDEGINQKFTALDSALNAGVTFSTDSDEIYSISIIDDSKLGFKGTANQIEVSTSRKKSTNNPNDWDSEVNIKFQLTETVEISTLRVSEHAQFDSDVSISGELEVGQQALFEDDIQVQGHAQFDSDVNITGQITVGQQALFEDDIQVQGHAQFDSDVNILGSLTVSGTTTYLNSQNLAVKDNFIVVNKGQSTPFNDTGIIFQRYDSDSVSVANWNAILEWDENDDSFIFGQTDESGLLPNPNIQNPYLSVGNTIEMYDSDNQPRLIWDKAKARLSILNKDGTEAFAFDADSGEMEGSGNIEGGFY